MQSQYLLRSTKVDRGTSPELAGPWQERSGDTWKETQNFFFSSFDAILKSALDLRPDTNILGGSISQDFQLSKRLEETVIAECMDVINAKRQSIVLQYDINNLERTFGATLSYYISMKYHEKGEIFLISFTNI